MNYDHLQQLTEEDYMDTDERLVEIAVDDKLVVVSCTMTKSDLLTLDGDSWLNDNVMNGYLAVLSRTSVNPVFVLPSFLAVRWSNNNISDNGWWYNKVQFSACRWLLMPVLVKNNHWVMLIADVPSRTVGVADTMSSHDTTITVVDNFVRYMDVQATMTGELDSWRRSTNTPSRVSRTAAAVESWH